MSWSRAQIIMLHKAAAAAGWNDAQRYLAMKHAGCPNGGNSRPSVNHPKNTNAAFDRVMELAEASAGAIGNTVPRPAEHASWRRAVAAQREPMMRLAQAIAHEASDRLPAHFDGGLLTGTIKHVCGGDHEEWFSNPADPWRLESLDGGQLYRVVESLKAHVGRVFAQCGLTPRTFEIPAEARRRAERKRGAA